MDAERWRRIEEVFQRAVDAPHDDRAAILEQSCGADASLRREVESLLAHYARGSDFIETPAAVSLSRKPGTKIGQYRILEEIGGGGMGVVYKAEDTKLGRSVALKFLTGYHSAAAGGIERVRREARVASSLNHPNVCVIYDIEDDAGEQFIAMEYIEGRTLAELLASGPLDSDTIATIGSQIADALGAAHRKGIIHRDIKPANIIVATTGLVKVLDFGVATLLDHERRLAAAVRVDTSAMAGTLPYMSPEQLHGAHVDKRADVFALGAVLYEMATGRRPFTGTAVAEVVEQISSRPPAAPQEINPGVALSLEAVILKCLEKEPLRRYQNAEEIAVELRRLLVPRSADHSGHTRRPWRAAAALGVTALATLMAIAIVAERRSTSTAPIAWEQLTDFPDSATSPALSPDGRMLTFIRGASTFVGPGDVYRKMLPDGDPVRLTTDSRPKQDPLFSPDGSRIVYTTGPLPYDVWQVPVSGGTPRLMMPNAGTLTWIGDGRVMFGEVRGLPHMAIVTATESRDEVRDVYVPARMSEMAHRAYLSPDRKWVLIAEMDTAGAGWLPCRLVPFGGRSSGTRVGPADSPCTSAAWSPDGRWMYLSAAPSGSYHIWRQRFPDGTPEQITFGPTEEEGIAMAPDGRSLVTSVGRAQSTLWIRDANGERKIDSEATVTFPRISADGRTLFYMAQRQLRDLDRQSGELWAVDIASGRRERLMPNARVVGYAVSPDGRTIAASVREDDGHSRLWLVPVDGRGPAKRVEWARAANGTVFNPAGGLFILAGSEGSQSVYQTDSDGGSARQVIAGPVGGVLAVSPSGKWILVRARLPGSNAASSGVVAYPLDGGAPVPVFNSMWSTANWTSDRRSFYMMFERYDGTEMTIATVPVSATQEIPPLPPGGLASLDDAARLPGAKTIGLGIPASTDLAGLAIAPDLSRVAIVRTAVQRNLYRVPLP